MKLLIINPGATSTKIAVFEDEEHLCYRVQRRNKITYIIPFP